MLGRVDAAVRGLRGLSDKVYFFSGNQYWRYDLQKDYGEVDYPRLITDGWTLPPEFRGGIDACLAGVGLYEDVTFFFRGGWFTSFDWTSKTQHVQKRLPLSRWCKGSPFPFPNGFDAALSGSGAYSDKAYFFKGDRYARYDWIEDRFDLVDQSLARWGLGERFRNGIDSCLSVAQSGSASSAYFFKGADYCRFDWSTDKAAEGYPLATAAGWPTGCAVWASHSQAPSNVCEDPRLDAGSDRRAVYPFGSLRGQAGWQVLTKFTTIAQLARQLHALPIPPWYGDDGAGKTLIPRRRITRLGLCAHGHGGFFEADGENTGRFDFDDEGLPQTGINDMRLLKQAELRSQFARIAEMLAPDAPVLLLGCEVAQTSTGGYLLSTLSRILKGHPITGITSVGYVSTEQKRGGGCDEAGMRDTNALHQGDANRTANKYWGNLVEWPWASETSPRAKTALNGEIVRRPREDRP